MALAGFPQSASSILFFLSNAWSIRGQLFRGLAHRLTSCRLSQPSKNEIDANWQCCPSFGNVNVYPRLNHSLTHPSTDNLLLHQNKLLESSTQGTRYSTRRISHLITISFPPFFFFFFGSPSIEVLDQESRCSVFW